MSRLHHASQRRPQAGAWPSLVRIAALALAIGACSDSPTQPQDERARLTVSATVTGTPVVAVVITVTAADIAQPLVFNLTVHDGLATGTLQVPPGAARTFAAQAFDSAGKITHDGTATADVQRGDNPPLSITMLPRMGQVPITITIGSVSVVVSPASAALIVGDTNRFVAAITYQGGQVVPGAHALWASSNPAVASVDSSGLVSAHAAGGAQVLAVFAGTAGASAVTVSAVPTPAAKIAFVGIRDGTVGILVMNADGTGETRLTNNIGGDYQPAWSPDRTRIAVRSSRDAYHTGNEEIYVMNADGTAQTRLTNNGTWDGEPAWSPDGTRIAYVSESGGGSDVYVMNADGTGQTRLTYGWALESKHNPAWSPDGARIAFNTNRDGNDEIYVMNADGTALTRLTNNPAHDSRPAWSPDGTRLAFASDRDGNWEIYLMNADGTGLTRLTNTAAQDEWPSWSPDGARIAFSSDRDGNGEIYVMNADGTGATRLTNNTTSDYSPAWR